MEDQINQIIEVLEELLEDSQTSKNARANLQTAIDELKNNPDKKAGIHKALHSLDELSENINLESYTRGQIWNIVSLLESLTA
jgi:uncharacterized protein (UPF0147 family)